VDVVEAIGVTCQNKFLLDYVDQKSYTKSFTDLGVMEQKIMRDDAEERYFSYAFIRQRGMQHGNFKVDLENDFTTGDDHYPRNRQQIMSFIWEDRR
jgi:hypothetical protein